MAKNKKTKVKIIYKIDNTPNESELSHDLRKAIFDQKSIIDKEYQKGKIFLSDN